MGGELNDNSLIPLISSRVLCKPGEELNDKLLFPDFFQHLVV